MLGHKGAKLVFLVLGCISLVLGLLGALLPLLPTTPFLLLAAYCFERSSDRLHSWLLNQKQLGPTIVDWNRHGVIRPRVKWISCVLLWTLILYPVLTREDLAWALKSLMLLVAGTVSVFILTRPNRPG